MSWLPLLLAAQFVEVGVPAGLTHQHENGASPQKLMMNLGELTNFFTDAYRKRLRR